MSKFDSIHRPTGEEESGIKPAETRESAGSIADRLSSKLVEARSRGEQLETQKFGSVEVSIQASGFNYSLPRTDNAKAYTHVELGFPNEIPPDYILEYAENPNSPTETVYGYVPIELVAKWMSEKSGAKPSEAAVKSEGVESIGSMTQGLSDKLVEARKNGQLLEQQRFGSVEVSVQAGRGNYSTPGTDDAKAYTHVELGFPNEAPPDYIMEYAENPNSPTETVYGYVPIELVARWMNEKGSAKPAKAEQNPSERRLTPEQIRERLNDPNFLPRRDEITAAFRGNWDAWNKFCFDKEKPVFEFLNEEHVTALAGYLGEQAKNRSKENPLVILEVGAGNGRLSHMLRKKLEAAVPDKVRIVATDSGDWELKTDFTVEQLGHKAAMDKHRPEVVIFSWMPYEKDISADFRASEGVKEYILIGETDGGCCGDEWETWGVSWGSDEDRGGGMAPYEKDGFERVDLDDLSELQSCRTDSPGDYYHSRTVSFRRKK